MPIHVITGDDIKPNDLIYPRSMLETPQKFLYDRTKSIVRMYKKITAIFVFLMCFLANLSSQVTVLEDSLFSPSINSISKFYIILPDGYFKSHERYTALYLLHGFGGDYSNWVKLTDLVKYLKQYNYIAICPDGKNSWYSNSVVLKDANFEDLIIKDVIPFIDKKYRTKQSKFNRAVAGLSMGGYGAAKFGLKFPGMFFFAGCVSPAIQFPTGLEDSSIVARRSKESNKSVREAFGETRNDSWEVSDVFLLAERSNAKSLPYFYLSVGSHDAIPEIIDLTHSFATTLRKKGAAFEMHESSGGHDWKFWDKELELILKQIIEVSGKKK